MSPLLQTTFTLLLMVFAYLWGYSNGRVSGTKNVLTLMDVSELEEILRRQRKRKRHD